ncbi:MAG: hypothetical protein NZM04_06155 [Methylacidiphilales bacterium]|nr:hypothetical protein [Candidatus Methylacidiphilales bacterium]
MIFQEDLSRAQMGFKAANFAVVRRFALKLLKIEQMEKDILVGKQLLAGRKDNNYILKVVQSGAILK